MNIRFEWNLAKATSNLRKHGISFQVAARVFADPLHSSEHDRTEIREDRWRTTGLAGTTLLAVAHTIRYELENDEHVEIIRIISARPATRRERYRYERESVG